VVAWVVDSNTLETVDYTLFLEEVFPHQSTPEGFIGLVKEVVHRFGDVPVVSAVVGGPASATLQRALLPLQRRLPFSFLMSPDYIISSVVEDALCVTEQVSSVIRRCHDMVIQLAEQNMIPQKAVKPLRLVSMMDHLGWTDVLDMINAVGIVRDALDPENIAVSRSDFTVLLQVTHSYDISFS